MNDKNILVGLDIGTTKVCTIIALKQKDDLEIIGVGSHPSYGLKKGSVVNIDKTVKSIRCSVEEAKLMAGINHIDKATIGVAGNHIYCFNSSGVVAVKNKQIQQEDVDRVIEAAKAVIIPSDREILHIIPQEFRVDKTKGIKDPIGMHGVRLEANVHIVTGQTPLIQNLIRCVEFSGISTDHVVLQPIASSQATLSIEEREIGVALVDIGGGTTDIAIWKDGSLLHSQIIPVGGNHFTNDLAVALKIPHNEAERIKINHGSVLAEKIHSHAHITVQGISGTRPREIQLSVIAEVLSSRAEELFTIVSDILREQGLEDEINGGFVLTGGGALIKDLTELAEYILERPTKIGHPSPFGSMTTVMQNPKFSTVLGLLLEAQNKTNLDNEEQYSSREKHFMSKIGHSFKSVFREIF